VTEMGSSTDKQNSEKRAPMAAQSCLFVVSAPSGAGKTTLCRAMLRRFPKLAYSVSYTTRPPRRGERHGVDYFFISTEDFRKGIDAGAWAEWANVHGNYYGTSLRQIETNLAAGRDMLLDIDVQGACQIVEKFPLSITIFIMPPSLEVLAERIRARRTDSRAVIARRLANARREIAKKDCYRYCIVNDRLDAAKESLAAVIARHGGRNRKAE